VENTSYHHRRILKGVSSKHSLEEFQPNKHTNWNLMPINWGCLIQEQHKTIHSLDKQRERQNWGNNIRDCEMLKNKRPIQDNGIFRNALPVSKVVMATKNQWEIKEKKHTKGEMQMLIHFQDELNNFQW